MEKSPVKAVKDFILRRAIKGRWAQEFDDDQDIENIDINDLTRTDSRPQSELESVRPIAKTEKKPYKEPEESLSRTVSYKLRVVPVTQSRDPAVNLILHATKRHSLRGKRTKFFQHRCEVCSQDFDELDEIRKPTDCEHLYHFKCLLAHVRAGNRSCCTCSTSLVI